MFTFISFGLEVLHYIVVLQLFKFFLMLCEFHTVLEFSKFGDVSNV